MALHVARGAADGLNQRAPGTQEAFFVGIENGDQRDLGQVEAFAQQVDADQHVVLAAAQVAQDAYAVQRGDFGVQVAAAHADLGIILRQVFRHALGERGDQHALIVVDAAVDLAEQIVHLSLDGADLHRGVQQAGGTDDLLHHHAGRLGEFVGAGRGGDVDQLVDAVFEFLEGERPVVERARHAETVGHQHFFARAVAVIHAVQLRDGLVAFIEKHDGIVGQVIEQGGRRFARQAAGEVAGVVLDAVAVADLLHHFEIEHGALLQALRFDEFALFLEFPAPPLQLVADAVHGAPLWFRPTSRSASWDRSAGAGRSA